MGPATACHVECLLTGGYEVMEEGQDTHSCGPRPTHSALSRGMGGVQGDGRGGRRWFQNAVGAHGVEDELGHELSDPHDVGSAWLKGA